MTTPHQPEPQASPMKKYAFKQPEPMSANKLMWNIHEACQGGNYVYATGLIDIFSAAIHDGAIDECIKCFPMTFGMDLLNYRESAIEKMKALKTTGESK